MPYKEEDKKYTAEDYGFALLCAYMGMCGN